MFYENAISLASQSSPRSFLRNFVTSTDSLERFNESARAHCKRFSLAIRYAHVNVANFKFPKIDLNSVRIVEYSDAAFASNADTKSHFRRIILLMGSADSAIPITLKSYKSRRVARSALSAEVVAFSDLFDADLTLKSQIEHGLGCSVSVHLLTDSKSLFEIISKGSRTNEKRIYA